MPRFLRAAGPACSAPFSPGGVADSSARVVSERLIGPKQNLSYGTIATAQQFVRGGKLKGLGVSSAKRSASLPGFVVDSWVGILATLGIEPVGDGPAELIRVE